MRFLILLASIASVISFPREQCLEIGEYCTNCRDCCCEGTQCKYAGDWNYKCRNSTTPEQCLEIGEYCTNCRDCCCEGTQCKYSGFAGDWDYECRIPTTTLGNIAQVDLIPHNPRNCDSYLRFGGKYWKSILLGLERTCECETGLDSCKYLYYSPSDGYLTCKEPVPSPCKRFANRLYDEWETVPNEEDKYCHEGYEISRTLAASCNPM